MPRKQTPSGPISDAQRQALSDRLGVAISPEMTWKFGLGLLNRLDLLETLQGEDPPFKSRDAFIALYQELHQLVGKHCEEIIPGHKKPNTGRVIAVVWRKENCTLAYLWRRDDLGRATVIRASGLQEKVKG